MTMIQVYCMRQVTLAGLTNSEVNDFRKEVARRMLLPPWDSYIKGNINVSYILHIVRLRHDINAVSFTMYLTLTGQWPRQEAQPRQRK